MYQGDCLKLLAGVERPVTTIFADPPDNIGLGYDQFDDRKADAEYVAWLGKLVEACVSKADVVWISFNAKWTFEMGRIFTDLIAANASNRFTPGGRTLSGKPCVQVFTFGQHNKNDFGNNHRPLWRLMWSDAKLYPDAVKVPSWRQRNGDKRAAEGGRVPGDVLDFQYPTPRTDTVAGSDQYLKRLAEHMIHPGDVLDFPRVTGNSKQRCDWHPTQLHEELVERCLKLSTGPTGTVLDPFGGTGTTMRVCRKLNLPCTLFEMDSGYCEKIAEANGLKAKKKGHWASC